MVDQNRMQYFNYPLTRNSVVNIQINVELGAIDLFITAGIHTPNEAFYDTAAVVEVGNSIDLLQNSSHFCASDALYVTVIGKEVTNVLSFTASK